MKIHKRFILGPLRTNCYVINTNGHDCIIDAGCEPQKMIDYCLDHNLNIEYILLTHTHYDHIGGLDLLKQVYPNAVVVVSKKEQSYLHDPEYNLSVLDDIYYCYHGRYITYEQLDKEVLGLYTFNISGHSLDSICLYFPDGNTVFSGDTLFRHTIGRSDFVNGNEYLLKEGIKRHLLTLPLNTKVCPGHGFYTTIEEEVNENKRLRG